MTDATKTNHKTFEKAVLELENILQKMEEGALSLDESLLFYQRGTALIHFCQAQLNRVEQQIQIIENAETQSNTVSEQDVFELDNIQNNKKLSKSKRARS